MCDNLLVSSSSILFDIFGNFTSDRNRLLDLIAEHSIENLYILTGDLHAGHAIEVTRKTAAYFVGILRITLRAKTQQVGLDEYQNPVASRKSLQAPFLSA